MLGSELAFVKRVDGDDVDVVNAFPPPPVTPPAEEAPVGGPGLCSRSLSGELA